MKRRLVVYSESSDDSDDSGDSGESVSEPEVDPRLSMYSELIVALEYSIRNVRLHGEYLTRAEKQFGNLNSLGSVLFQQSISPRWSKEFINILKTTRMVRVRVLFGDEGEVQNSCTICKNNEISCKRGVEFIGGNGVSCKLCDLPDAFDAQEDANKHLCKTFDDKEYLGVYVVGYRCFDLAMAAVVANNLVGDTCQDIKQELDHVLQDKQLAKGLQEDENEPTRTIFPLVDSLTIAAKLMARIAAIEGVLTGKSFPDVSIRRTGSLEVWKSLDGSFQKKFSTREDALRFSRERSDSLLKIARGRPTATPTPTRVHQTRHRTQSNKSRSETSTPSPL